MFGFDKLVIAIHWISLVMMARFGKKFGQRLTILLK